MACPNAAGALAVASRTTSAKPPVASWKAATGSVSAESTAGTLLALAISAVAVAGLGAFVIAMRGSTADDVLEPATEQAFIAVVGGSGVAGALLSLTATCATVLVMAHGDVAIRHVVPVIVAVNADGEHVRAAGGKLRGAVAVVEVHVEDVGALDGAF